MTSTLTVRPCRIEECPVVLRIWREADATPSVTDTLDELHRFVAEFDGQLLIAEQDGQVVGTIIAGWDGWRASIYRLAVLPEYRRMGVARALLLEAERRLQAKGARRLSILVESHDTQAAAFWDSLASYGYERDPRIMRYVRTI
ncbi:MAG: GNAT family N-acetyltransferase [Actinomycetota bacterium]